MTTEKQVTREFLGELHGTKADRYKRNFNKKMLKAYIRGDQYFCFGYSKDEITGQPVRNYFPVECIEHPKTVYITKKARE